MYVRKLFFENVRCHKLSAWQSSSQTVTTFFTVNIYLNNALHTHMYIYNIYNVYTCSSFVHVYRISEVQNAASYLRVFGWYDVPNKTGLKTSDTKIWIHKIASAGPRAKYWKLILDRFVCWNRVIMQQSTPEDHNKSIVIWSPKILPQKSIYFF